MSFSKEELTRQINRIEQIRHRFSFFMGHKAIHEHMKESLEESGSTLNAIGIAMPRMLSAREIAELKEEVKKKGGSVERCVLWTVADTHILLYSTKKQDLQAHRRRERNARRTRRWQCSRSCRED